MSAGAHGSSAFRSSLTAEDAREAVVPSFLSKLTPFLSTCHVLMRICETLVSVAVPLAPTFEATYAVGTVVTYPTSATHDAPAAVNMGKDQDIQQNWLR